MNFDWLEEFVIDGVDRIIERGAAHGQDIEDEEKHLFAQRLRERFVQELLSGVTRAVKRMLIEA